MATTAAVFVALFSTLFCLSQRVFGEDLNNLSETDSVNKGLNVAQSYVNNIMYKVMSKYRWPTTPQQTEEDDIFDNSVSVSDKRRYSWDRSKKTEYFYMKPSQFTKDEIYKLSEIAEAAEVIPLEQQVISQTLSLRNKPFVTFEMHDNRTFYQFELDKEVRRIYNISIVVEKMSCRKKMGQSPMLYIRGEQTATDLCTDVDNSVTDFQSVTHFTEGGKFVNITAVGDWSDNVSVSLALSIYYETSDCHNCAVNNHFCCGSKTGACQQRSASTMESEAEISVNDLKINLRRPDEVYRCIPRKDENGNTAICNGHPNCGLHCNLDELNDYCPKDGGNGEDEDPKCDSYYCREGRDRFLLLVMLLTLFCIFIPLCIFLVFCTRKEFRRDLTTRGRCPLPLEIIFCPFSISTDPGELSNSGVNSEVRRGNRRHRVRRSEEQSGGGVSNLGYFDDLPPPYSECYNNKTVYPTPPKFPNDFTLSESHGARNAPSTSADFETFPTVHQTSILIQSLTQIEPVELEATKQEDSVGISKTQSVSNQVSSAGDSSAIEADFQLAPPVYSESSANSV